MADTVTVKNPYGQLGVIDKAKLPEALKVGYQIAPDDEIKAYNDKQEYGQGIGNALKTFAESGLGALTFGGSRQLENATGLTTPEAQAARQKYNPVASGAGTAAGIIGPLLVAPEAVGAKEAQAAYEAAQATGDAAKIAEASNALKTAKNTLTAGDALNPVSAVSKIGGKVTQAATRTLPQDAGIASQIIANVPGAALGSAVEGAAYGLGQSVNEDALGDPALNAEKVMSNVGYGALLGGGIGAAFKGAEIGIPKVVEGAKDAIEATTRKLLGPADEVGPLGKMYAKASSFVSGKPEESILEGLRGRTELIENPELREKVAGEFASTLQEHVDKINEALKRTNRDIRPEEIQNSLSEMPRAQAMEHSLSLWNKVHDAAEHMEQHPALYPQGAVYKLKALSDELRNTLMETKSAGDVYSTINKFKQDLDKQFKIFGRTIDPAYADTANVLKGLRGDVKASLENEALWGKAAVRQQAFNEAQNELLHLTGKGGDFNKAFLNKVPTRSGGFTYEVSPNKVKAFFNQVKDLRGQDKAEALQNFINSSKRTLGEIENTYKNVPDRTFDRHAVESVIEKNYAAAQKAQKQAELQKTLGGLGSGGHNAYLGEGMAGYAAMHHPLLGGAIEAFTMLRNPNLAIQRLAKIERMAQRTSDQVSRGAKAIFKTGAAVSGDVAGVLGPRLEPNGEHAFKPAADNNKKKETIALLNELQSNPQKLFDKLHESTKDIADHAPNTAMNLASSASTAVQFLQSKAPQTLPNGPLSRPLEPSQSELAKFGRYVRIVENPIAILSDVQTGMITPEAMEAMQAVYPKLLNEMQNQVGMELVNFAHSKGAHSVPYAKKLALSLFLGQDMDSSLAQNEIMENQVSIMHATQPPPAPMTGKGTSKLTQNESMKTPMQETAERDA